MYLSTVLDDFSRYIIAWNPRRSKKEQNFVMGWQFGESRFSKFRKGRLPCVALIEPGCQG